MNSFFFNGKLSENDGTVENLEINVDTFVDPIETRSKSMLGESAFGLKHDEMEFKNFDLFFSKTDFRLDVVNVDFGFEIFNEILNILVI